MAAAAMMPQGGRLQIAGDRTSGADVRTQNVTAVTAIANIVKTSLGPVGLDKVRFCVVWLWLWGGGGKKAISRCAQHTTHSAQTAHAACCKRAAGAAAARLLRVSRPTYDTATNTINNRCWSTTWAT
jgi:hypothetical protein